MTVSLYKGNMKDPYSDGTVLSLGCGDVHMNSYVTELHRTEYASAC